MGGMVAGYIGLFLDWFIYIKEKMWIRYLSILIMIIFGYFIAFMEYLINSLGFFVIVFISPFFGISFFLAFPALFATSLLFGLCLFKILRSIIEKLNNFSGGHALGTVGVVLAFLGFIGELYQILTIYLEGIPAT